MNFSAKIPDQLGYLVLHETGATISSGGDLENDERIADIIYNLISLTDILDNVAFPEGGFNRVSICYKDFCYVICKSNKKIYIVKRKFAVGLNASKATSEPQLIDFQGVITNSIDA